MMSPTNSPANDWQYRLATKTVVFIVHSKILPLVNWKLERLKTMPIHTPKPDQYFLEAWCLFYGHQLTGLWDSDMIVAKIFSATSTAWIASTWQKGINKWDLQRPKTKDFIWFLQLPLDTSIFQRLYILKMREMIKKMLLCAKAIECLPRSGIPFEAEFLMSIIQMAGGEVLASASSALLIIDSTKQYHIYRYCQSFSWQEQRFSQSVASTNVRKMSVRGARHSEFPVADISTALNLVQKYFKLTSKMPLSLQLFFLSNAELRSLKEIIRQGRIVKFFEIYWTHSIRKMMMHKKLTHLFNKQNLVPITTQFSNQLESVQVTISSNLPKRTYQLIVGDEVDLEVSSHCSALASKFCWQILGTSITFVMITKVSKGGIEMMRVKIHDDAENMSRFRSGPGPTLDDFDKG